LSIEVNPDGSPRAFLTPAADGVAVTISGLAGDIVVGRAYTFIFKWGVGGLSLALWDDVGTLKRRVTNPLEDGVTSTSVIRFGAWHGDGRKQCEDGARTRVSADVRVAEEWPLDTSTTQHGHLYRLHRWKEASKRFLSRPENALCRPCRARGKVVASREVHHEPHYGGDPLAF
jgi:hypothetical protein